MTLIAEKTRSEALALDVEERAELAHELILSLEESLDTDVERAWDEEIRRRKQKYKTGEVVGRPAEQVLAEIRAKYQ